jgi:4-amino-4-deoxy-L-arabinose transferase-like glycosyltransferase
MNRDGRSRLSHLTQLVTVVAGVLVAVFLAWRWAVSISGTPIDMDGEDNLLMAYNFAVHGVLSGDKPNNGRNEHMRPTNYREPLPPLVVGLYLKMLQRLQIPISLESILRGPGARLIKFSNFIWGIILCVSVFAALKAVTANSLIALVGVLITGVKAIKTQRLLYYGLAGLSLGALVLTKGAFVIVSLALVLCLLFGSIRQWRCGVRRTAVGLIVFVFCITISIAPWLVRNYRNFGSLTVTERSGVVLMIRARYDEMNSTEYLGSFYVWAPEAWIGNALGRILGFNAGDLMRGGRLQRLNRDDSADFASEDWAAEVAGKPEAAISYYRRARAERNKLERELAKRDHPHADAEQQKRLSDDPLIVDAADIELRKRALELIISNPIKHIFTTVPFFWRGVPFVAIFLITFSIFAMKRRRYDLVAYMLPTIGMILFYAAASHNVPRYNVPAQPIAAVMLIVMAQLLVHRFLEKVGVIDGETRRMKDQVTQRDIMIRG